MSDRSLWIRLRWPEVAVESAPKPVRDAFAAHEKAADIAEEARRKEDAASESFRNADRDDHTATVLATREGRALPVSVKEERRAALEDARRVYNACCDLAVEAERNLIAAAGEHRAEWMDALGPSLKQSVLDAQEGLEQCQRLLEAVSSQAGVWRWLDSGRLDRRVGGTSVEALAPALSLLLKMTPEAIQEQISQRRAEEQALAEDMRNSLGGVVVKRLRT